MRRLLPILCATLLTGVATIQGAAAQSYPSKDIRMIVPWGAGGGTDGIVRKISTLAEKQLGGTIYVENIEGGVSATGVMQAMKARPDGYTVAALTYDSVITVPFQKLLPGYAMDKLDFVARITSEPDAIIVSKDAPYKTLDDLVKAAKANPGTVKVAIQNIGSRTHLAMLRLQNLTGAQFKLIAYPGGAAPQKEALLSGEAQVAVTSLGDFASLIESGDARGLIEFSDARNPTYRDVPNTKDAGLDLQVGSFILLAVPDGTPKDAVGKLEAAYKAAYDSKEFQDWVAKVGVTPSWLPAEKSGPWVEQTQKEIFGLMKKLQDEGVLKK